MRGQGEKWAATAGGAALVVALWAPWFNRRLAGGFAHLPSISGWRALGTTIGALALVAAGLAVAWAFLPRRPSGAWLVVAGAFTLLAEIAATVNRIGVEGPVTTTPAPGVALAFVGAAVIVLAGLAGLLRR